LPLQRDAVNCKRRLGLQFVGNVIDDVTNSNSTATSDGDAQQSLNTTALELVPHPRTRNMHARAARTSIAHKALMNWLRAACGTSRGPDLHGTLQPLGQPFQPPSHLLFCCRW
jgi:hypothetical protein